MVRLHPCDIVFFTSKSKLSGLIRFMTRSIGEPKSIASHVGIIVDGGELWNAVLIEAQTKVNRHTMGEAYGKKKDEFVVFRPINLTPKEKDAIILKSESYVGDSYGYIKLLAYFGDWLLNGANVFRRLCRIDSKPICSYLVARSFEAAGKDFGVPGYSASPDDMWDFCVEHGDKYQFVTQRGDMYNL